MAMYSPYNPKNAFRVRRFMLLKESIEAVMSAQGRCSILDVGGEPDYWETFGSDLQWDRLKLCVLNLAFLKTSHPSITAVVGDARDMKQFDNLSFDIVHSNSVIEHVGRWNDMVWMANEVRRLAPRYFVQTPYFWFPLEAHTRFPFFHWMPESWRYRIIMIRNCGTWKKQPELEGAMRAVQSVSLLDRQQMRFLFPDAKIVSERVLGITKSLIAIR